MPGSCSAPLLHCRRRYWQPRAMLAVCCEPPRRGRLHRIPGRPGSTPQTRTTIARREDVPHPLRRRQQAKLNRARRRWRHISLSKAANELHPLNLRTHAFSWWPSAPEALRQDATSAVSTRYDMYILSDFACFADLACIVPCRLLAWAAAHRESPQTGGREVYEHFSQWRSATAAGPRTVCGDFRRQEVSVPGVLHRNLSSCETRPSTC